MQQITLAEVHVKCSDELKERASARGEKFTMTVNQVRTKFQPVLLDLGRKLMNVVCVL